MTNENNRLLNLLKENKISKEEFQVLSSALDKKPSLAGKLFNVLINPFQKMAGLQALAIGFAILCCISYLGVIAKVYFPGILECLNSSVVKDPRFELSFSILLCQLIISWLTLSVLFLIAAKLFQQKRIRMIDFFGTVALSRYPFLVLAAILAVIRITNPSFLNIDLSQGYQLDSSMIMTLFGAVVIICIIWQITTYFFALKESSGLTGKKLWVSFIAAMVLGEVIASILTLRLVTL